MILYHGSYTEIEKIDLSKSATGKDFGRGFYTTTINKHAIAMAKREGDKRRCKGVVSTFEFNYEDVFSNERYNTLSFKDYSPEWLDFIDINRSNEEKRQAHNYDIVEGPIADDWVSQNMPLYKSGKISRKQFISDLCYKGGLTHQICFCTLKSLETIERISLETSIQKGRIASSITCNLEINDRLSEKNAQELFYNSETFKKLSDENTKLYTKNWKEIYEMLKAEVETVNKIAGVSRRNLQKKEKSNE